MGDIVAGDALVEGFRITHQDEILNPFVAVLLRQRRFFDQAAVDQAHVTAERIQRSIRTGLGRRDPGIAVLGRLRFGNVLLDFGSPFIPSFAVFRVFRSFWKIQNNTGFFVAWVGQAMVVAIERPQFDPAVSKFPKGR